MCGVYQHADQDSGVELATEQWKGVLDSAAALGTMIASFTGGEALLRSDLFELIRHARGKGMAVHLCSNGASITKANAEKLEAAGTNTVSVSVESPSRELHDYLRGCGSFDQAIRGIRMLREHAPGIRVGINYIITAANYAEMNRMIPFAESLGVHQIKFAPIHTNLQHKNKSLEDFKDLLLKGEDLKALEVEVQKLIKAVRRTKLQTTSTAFLRGIASLYQEPRKFRCYAGFAACTVDPQGFVGPCCDFSPSVNVKEKSLHEIWRSDEFQALRQKVFSCDSSCWDTTNTELSLRLSLRSLIRDLPETLRDIKFYFGGSR